MTPKEKAREIVYKMEKDFQYFASREIAKQHALIAVDEILNLMINNFKWDINYNGNIEYWQQVKQEIQAL
jgi:hypothetical protein